MKIYRKIFVMGDIHGAYKALLQCLSRSGFDPKTDLLIQLGDVADGWPEVYECVQFLTELPNLIAIQGNHDEWTLEYMLKGFSGMAEYHYSQGGEATHTSYYHRTTQQRDRHIAFFRSQIPYYKDQLKNVFVHGGFDQNYTLENQEWRKHVFLWDRDLLKEAIRLHDDKVPRKMAMVEDVNEIFIGHTQTRDTKPLHACNLWNLDTGAGWNGKLTIMDVDTKEYWQSDNVLELYTHGGRFRTPLPD